MQRNEAEIRISILRFIMIFGVVVLHVPPHVPIAEIGPGAFDQLKAFFQSAVFRCSVPVLTVISGYLLFRAGLDRRYGALLRKKLKTLVVPFLAFNLPLVALAFLLQSGGDFAISYQLVPLDAATMLDAAFAFSAAPLNFPLYFLRDLMVLALAAPLLGWCLRHAALPGLAAALLIMLYDLDGPLLLRTEMLVAFYVGGMAALRGWNLHALDRFAWPALLAFLLAAAAMVAGRVENTTWLGLAAPFLVWPAASLLDGTRTGRWLAGMGRYSFFIFLAHSVVLLVAWMAWRHLAGGLPYPLFWAVAPFATVALLVALHRLASRHLGDPFHRLLGARGPAPRAVAG